MEKIKQILTDCVPEGIVLLERNAALPLSATDRVAVFGRGQFEYLKSGTGSGGRVNCPYCTQIESELKTKVIIDLEVSGFYKRFIEENPLDTGDGWSLPPVPLQPELSEEFVKKAAAENDKAVYILSRLAGEAYDCVAEKGGWYLTDVEEHNIRILKKHFPDIIVLVNSGNIIDMSWVKKYDVKNVMLIWYGGQDGAGGTVAALTGAIPPSGRLTDAVAKDIIYYPSQRNFGNAVKNVHAEDVYVGYRYFETFAKDKVLYPFGYGKNYTEFSQQVLNVEKSDDRLIFTVSVENTGEYNGKDVIQIYYSAPNGNYGVPVKQLLAYKKTDMLSSGEKKVYEICADIKEMAVYDDSGKTGFPFCYVLAKGEYYLYVGKNVRESVLCFSFLQKDFRVIKRCRQSLAPREKFKRLFRSAGSAAEEFAPVKITDNAENVRESKNVLSKRTVDFGSVKGDAEKMRVFADGLSEEELCSLAHGEGMSSIKASIPGTAAVFGGVTPSLAKKGVPIATVCDGPSGLRIECDVTATSIPCGTLIASSWCPERFGEVFDIIADEMIKYDIDVLLGPGMNIHRDPLCGRNFEYFSEDPLITGKFAAMIAERLYNKGVFCTLKHFAVNSQETARGRENEVLSERALREIYLKGFEIAVKSGFVKAIMTSYNRINGISACASYDLTTEILRNEWGYDGFVMTDWWTGIDDAAKGTFDNKNYSAMVRAGTNIYMVVPDALNNDDDLKTEIESGRLSVERLRNSAIDILSFLAKTRAFKKGRILSDYLTLETEREAVYVTENTDRFKPQLEENMYIAEIEYAIKGDVLEQATIKVFVDKKDAIIIMVNGTDGIKTTKKFRIYLTPFSEIKVEGDGVLKLAIYKEKKS